MMMKTTKHISKDGRGRITSKITKPKDWAYRTPSEGRAKHVHSPRAKKIKMQHSMQSGKYLKQMLLDYSVGMNYCQWKVSCELPFLAKFDVRDTLYAYHGMENQDTYEIKFNREHKILIFCDLEGVLTGAREEAIAPALTKDEIEIAKRHTSKTAKESKENIKMKKKLPGREGYTLIELLWAIFSICFTLAIGLIAFHFISKYW